MFIWDFLAENVLGQILDWLYARVVEAFGEFFVSMDQMGVSIFASPWAQALVELFAKFGFALFMVGFVVAVFEYGIESQSGRGDLKGLMLNTLKGFLAALLFPRVPVELYKVAVDLQANVVTDLTGITTTARGIGEAAYTVMQLFSFSNLLFSLAMTILLGYCVIKVFFGNLKRGGILLIQIAVGALYQFSVPRGYGDGFTNWCKQVIGLCLTSFMQTTLLITGLMISSDSILLGIGVVLAAGEVPRICGAFGLDTSTRANIMSAMYSAQSVYNSVRTVVSATAK